VSDSGGGGDNSSSDISGTNSGNSLDGTSGKASDPATTQDAVLGAALLMAGPLVRLLMAHGVDHPRFAAGLKRVFIDEARADLSRRGQKVTHTALSLLAGLQRRDVKALVAAAEDQPLPRKATSPTLPLQAVARWASDSQFLDAEGAPLPLPLRSADRNQATFEQLADLVSKDVHPPALLEEMVRLGFAQVDDGIATLGTITPVAPGELKRILGAMSRNTRDHLAAGVANVLAPKPLFLEYSMIADELRPDSAEELHVLAKKLWTGAYKRAVQSATELVERDIERGFTVEQPETRVRFGVYFYSEPKEPVPVEDAAPEEGDDA
jgi:hypothetical protein